MQEASTALNTSDSAAAQSERLTKIRGFLAFKQGGEEYGMDILWVQEIRSYGQPTKMVNAPAFIKGVVNLLSVIVPILDMRMKCKRPQVEYNAFIAVIVLNIGHQVLGMVVDGVSDVLSLTPKQLRLPSGSISALEATISWPSARYWTAC